VPAPITPLPAISSAPRVIYVVGGSFDPPHRLHRLAPAKVAENLGVAPWWLLFVPAAKNPLKKKGPNASDEDRVAMLHALVKGAPGMGVWTDEIDRAAWERERCRGGPSYTIDTVKRLRRLVGASLPVRLLIGADQALAFHRWKDAKEILRLAPPLVMPREHIENPLHLAEALQRDKEAVAFWGAEGIGWWAMRLAPSPLVPESSTRLRKLLAGTRSQRLAARELLPPAVARVVEKRGLYETRSASAAHQ
jgi:nicotinate-nucleotide adenylyltransferase